MKIGSGMVSTVYLHNNTVSKEYLSPFEKHTDRSIQQHWIREVEALKKLSGHKHFPEVIDIDEINHIIIMSYCGELLTKENLPLDWEKQCEQIQSICMELSIFHQDFIGLETNTKPPHHKNILVKEGIIYIVDFGMWGKKESRFKDTITSIIRKVYESN